MKGLFVKKCFILLLFFFQITFTCDAKLGETPSDAAKHYGGIRQGSEKYEGNRLEFVCPAATGALINFRLVFYDKICQQIEYFGTPFTIPEAQQLLQKNSWGGVWQSTSIDKVPSNVAVEWKRDDGGIAILSPDRSSLIVTSGKFYQIIKALEKKRLEQIHLEKKAIIRKL